MAELLSRAYERLNRILGLAGNQALNSIDIDSAFAVHPLGPVIQAELVEPFVASTNHTFAGAATHETSLNLRELVLADWDIIVRGPRQATTGDDNPILPDDDIVITSVSISSTANNCTNALFLLSDGTGPGTYWPITNLLEVTMFLSAATYMIYDGGSDYYRSEPPFYLHRDADYILPYVRYVATGAGITTYQMHGFVAPPGVIALPIHGGK